MSFGSKIFPVLILAVAVATALGSPSASELLRKKGFSWKTVESDHLRVHFELENKYAAERIDYLKAKQERAYIANLRLLEVVEGIGKVDVFVVASRERMKKLVGDETNGVAFPSKQVLCFIFNESLDVTSAHEMMHVLAGNVWGLKFKPWINEGWAGVADNGWHGHDLYNLNKYLLERKKLYPIARLIGDFGDLPHMITYPQAAAFVKFLHESYGTAVIRNLWRNSNPNEMKHLTGKTIAQLESDWHKKLMDADSGAVVYNY